MIGTKDNSFPNPVKQFQWDLWVGIYVSFVPEM